MGTGFIAFIVLFVVSFSLLTYLFIWGTRQIGKNKGRAQTFDSSDMLGRTYRAFEFAAFWLSLAFIALLVAQEKVKSGVLLAEFVVFCIVLFVLHKLTARALDKKRLDSENRKFRAKALKVLSLHTLVWTLIFGVLYMVFILA